MRVAILVLIASCVPAQSVLLNEIGTGTPDFIELRNTSASAVDLSGWTLSTWYQASQVAAPVAEGIVTLPSGLEIPAGGLLVFEEQGQAFFPGAAGNCSLHTGTNLTWTSSYAVEVVLADATGTGRDYVYRRPFAGPQAPHLPLGLAWTGVLSAASGDSIHRPSNSVLTESAHWTVQAAPSPCAANPGQWTGLHLEISTLGQGDASFALRSFPSLPSAEVWTFYSLVDHMPDGSGPFLGIGIDALPQIFLPIAPQSPFHSLLGPGGDLILAFGPGTLAPGTFFEATSLARVGFALFGPAPVIARTF